jgi:hypothetical protein
MLSPGFLGRQPSANPESLLHRHAKHGSDKLRHSIASRMRIALPCLVQQSVVFFLHLVLPYILFGVSKSALFKHPEFVTL